MSDQSSPEMSVVIVTDRCQTIRKTLLNQKGLFTIFRAGKAPQEKYDLEFQRSCYLRKQDRQMEAV